MVDQEVEAAEDGEEAPRSIDTTSTSQDVLRRIVVLDDATGARIDKIISADADAGKVVRFAVENGGLVIQDNRFVTIEEDRAIRIEWLGNRRRNSF